MLIDLKYNVSYTATVTQKCKPNMVHDILINDLSMQKSEISNVFF